MNTATFYFAWPARGAVRRRGRHPRTAGPRDQGCAHHRVLPRRRGAEAGGLRWTVADDGASTDRGYSTAGGGTAPAGIVLDAVVCADDVAAGRPAPYMIHRAMELTGVQDVREVLAAGDTASDLLAATRAGVTAVGVLTGKLDRTALEQHPHHHILDGVRDIPAVLV